MTDGRAPVRGAVRHSDSFLADSSRQLHGRGCVRVATRIGLVRLVGCCHLMQASLLRRASACPARSLWTKRVALQMALGVPESYPWARVRARRWQAAGICCGSPGSTIVASLLTVSLKYRCLPVDRFGGAALGCHRISGQRRRGGDRPAGPAGGCETRPTRSTTSAAAKPCLSSGIEGSHDLRCRYGDLRHLHPQTVPP